MGEESRSLTYQKYLLLQKLLSLQETRTPSEHELPFMVVHQAVELFFKCALVQNVDVVDRMKKGEINGLPEKISRPICAINMAKTIAGYLNRMNPRQFAEFRSALGRASGAESHQFKEIEIQSGLRKEQVINTFEPGSWEDKAIRTRISSPSLRDAFLDLLQRWGLVSGACECTTATCEEMLDALRRIYAEPRFTALLEIAEALYEYDEAFVQFRLHHLQLVRSMIGGAPGTGGTSGLLYLENRLKLRFFPEIAAARTEIV